MWQKCELNVVLYFKFGQEVRKIVPWIFLESIIPEVLVYWWGRFGAPHWRKHSLLRHNFWASTEIVRGWGNGIFAFFHLKCSRQHFGCSKLCVNTISHYLMLHEKTMKHYPASPTRPKEYFPFPRGYSGHWFGSLVDSGGPGLPGGSQTSKAQAHSFW